MLPIIYKVDPKYLGEYLIFGLFLFLLLTTGISILYKKPQKKPPNLFSFLSPLSVEVWIYMCTAYLAVSLSIYAMSRYTKHLTHFGTHKQSKISGSHFPKIFTVTSP